jgi:hypothetical protein
MPNDSAQFSPCSLLIAFPSQRQELDLRVSARGVNASLLSSLGELLRLLNEGPSLINPALGPLLVERLIGERRSFDRNNPRLRRSPKSNRLRRDCQRSIVSFDPPRDPLLLNP